MNRVEAIERHASAGLVGAAVLCAGGCGTLMHHSWSDDRRAEFMLRTFEPGMTPSEVEQGLRKVKGSEVVTDAPAPTPEQWETYIEDRVHSGDYDFWRDPRRVPGDIDPFHYEDVATKRGWDGPRLMQVEYADSRMFETSQWMMRPSWMWFAFDERDHLERYGLVDPGESYLSFP